MKKNYFIIALLLFLSLSKVNAQQLCTSSNYSKVKKEAYNVNYTYEMERSSDNEVYFQVRVMNLKKSIMLIYDETVYEYSNTGDTFLLPKKFEGGETVEFKIYGSYDSPCTEELMYSKKLKIPKYNIYSEEEECFEYEEFELCNKWYQGTIPNKAYFTEKLEEYKKSITKEEPVKEEKDNHSLINKIIDFYVDNIIITGSITILIIGIVFYFVIRSIIRKRKRVKIDFDFKV